MSQIKVSQEIWVQFYCTALPVARENFAQVAKSKNVTPEEYFDSLPVVAAANMADAMSKELLVRYPDQ
jgi:hypothetical protein